MNEHDQEQPRVKVTDRRRVRADGEPQAGSPVEPQPEETGAVEAGRVQSGPAEAAVEGGRPGDFGEATASDGGGGADLEQARRQASEYLDHLQRLKAEFDNYRKRVLKEQTRVVEMASEPLVRHLLEVLDEFDLALMAAEQRPDFDKFLHGVELVYAKLKDILTGEGLERIDAEGKPFDPEQHEALMQSGNGDGEPVVADVLRPGYTMKGRVIRPAGVRVTRK